MSIFKKKKVSTELEPVARLQVGNYIIKEWGRSATPAGVVYNVPVITIEDVALTWRVSVESSHSRYLLLWEALHFEENYTGDPSEMQQKKMDCEKAISNFCYITFFMTTEAFLTNPDESGKRNIDWNVLQDVANAMEGYAARRVKEIEASQTDAERAKADAEALDEMQHPEKAVDEL